MYIQCSPPSPSLYRPIAGTYVALTLQGPPPSSVALPLEPLPTDLLPNQRTSLGGEAPPPPPPPLPSGLTSTPSQRITGPKPLQVTNGKDTQFRLLTIIPHGETGRDRFSQALVLSCLLEGHIKLTLTVEMSPSLACNLASFWPELTADVNTLDTEPDNPK